MGQGVDDGPWIVTAIGPTPETSRMMLNHLVDSITGLQFPNHERHPVTNNAEQDAADREDGQWYAETNGLVDPPPKFDPVHRPKGYNSHPSGMECIELSRRLGSDLGQAVQYVWRAEHKGTPKQDYEKALWFVTDYLDHDDAVVGDLVHLDVAEKLERVQAAETDPWRKQFFQSLRLGVIAEAAVALQMLIGETPEPVKTFIEIPVPEDFA